MKRIASVAILAVGTLTACGGGDSYCDKLKGYFEGEGLADVDVKVLDASRPHSGREWLALPEERRQMQKNIDVIGDLESDAPSELKEDYRVVLYSLSELMYGHPENMDPKFPDAATNISEDARQNCDFGSGG